VRLCFQYRDNVPNAGPSAIIFLMVKLRREDCTFLAFGSNAITAILWLSFFQELWAKSKWG